MIHCELANLIREKMTFFQLLFFLLVVGFIGDILQRFESYTMFWLMLSLLLIMLSSVVLILQFCLKKLSEFQENCTEEVIKEHYEKLFPPKSNSLLFGVYILMVAAYFICIYNMQFVEINIMGLYILILGGSTFFLALICYEICVRLTIYLREIEKNISKVEYDNIYPQNTSWLQYFFSLHKIIKNSAMAVSILFVLENSMLFVVNYKKLSNPIVINMGKISIRLIPLPFEGWAIWAYISIAIVVAIPIMTQLRSQSLSHIIEYIQKDFPQKMTRKYKVSSPSTNLQDYFSFLNIVQINQKTLTEAYLPHHIDRFASLIASLLTCFAHLLSFCMILIPNLS